MGYLSSFGMFRLRARDAAAQECNVFMRSAQHDRHAAVWRELLAIGGRTLCCAGAGLRQRGEEIVSLLFQPLAAGCACARKPAPRTGLTSSAPPGLEYG